MTGKGSRNSHIPTPNMRAAQEISSLILMKTRGSASKHAVGTEAIRKIHKPGNDMTSLF